MSKKSNNFVGCNHSINIFVPETKEHIKVEGHVGLWYVIDQKYYENIGTLYLCEHETYGDEAACIIIDKDYNLILDDVWNGFDDYEEAVAWEEYKKDMFSILKEKKLMETPLMGMEIQKVTMYQVKFENQIYEVILLNTPINATEKNITFYYQSGRPTRYGILEEKLKEYYSNNK